MSWLTRLADRRRRSKEVQKAIDLGKLGQYHRESQTFVMDAQWSRTEELRPDRLGPGEDDLTDVVRVDPWRPKRTLGPMRKR